MKSTRVFFFTLFVSLLSLSGYSQSVDERIGKAMNNGQWREVRRLYLSEGKDLQTPLLHPLSNFFLYHFYNQPDSAIHYGTVLLNEYQQDLGESVSSIIYFMADDYARLGEYDSAADILHQLNEATRAAAQEPNSLFVGFENQYKTIASYGKFCVIRPPYDVKVPIRYHGKNRKDPVMLFVTAELNGIKYDINYDTGAGVNIISQELVDKIGAHVIDTKGIDVTGIQKQSSHFVILDSLKLGDVLYKNVPFQIVDFSTGNKEADAKIKELNYQCVVGSQTMLPLGEIRFDFANGNLIIPAKQTPKPDFAPNLYRSEGNMLILSIFDKRSEEIMEGLLDTGASLSMLTSKYYNRNKSQFTDVTFNDSIRMAGVGGVETATKTFTIKWDYEVGGVHASVDSIMVNTSDTDSKSQYECLFGLPTLTQHDLVILNFKDMWIGISPFCK